MRLLAAAGVGRRSRLWAALVTGSLCGALAHHRINLAAIWFAAALALSAIVAATHNHL
jgi:uncharacterized membrane protein YoaK (UPF0700 family)